MAFTKRLKARVAQDAELSVWLSCERTQRAVMPGLAGIHQSWWSVKSMAPPSTEPQEWYAEFVRRWQDYLASLAEGDPCPTPAASLPSPSDAHRPPLQPLARPPSKSSRRRPVEDVGPSKRQRRPTEAPSPPDDPIAVAALPVAAPSFPPPGPLRRMSPPSSPRPPKRQRTLLGWFQPACPDPSAASSSTTVFHQPFAPPGHGRATAGTTVPPYLALVGMGARQLGGLRLPSRHSVP